MQNASIAAPGQSGFGQGSLSKTLIWRATSMAKNKTKAKTAIYHPPVESKEEARVLASKKTLKVLLEDERPEEQH